MGVLGVGLNTSGGVGSFLKNPFTLEVGGKLRGDDFAEGFSIQEINAVLPGGLGVKVSLVGNMMPKQPFTYAGEQHVVKEYYPGNPEAAVHILGAREPDFTVQGRLYAKRFQGQSLEKIPGAALVTGSLEDSMYSLPAAMRDEIDNIRQRGNIVLVKLGEWKRYCILTKCEWQVKKLGDIDYALTFTVVSINAPSRCPIIEDTKLFPLALKSPLTDLAEQLSADAAARRVPSSVPVDFVDLLNEAVDVFAGAVATVTGFMDDLIAKGEEVNSTVNRAVGIVKTAEADVSRMRLRLGRISHGLAFAGLNVPDRYNTSAIIGYRMSVSNDISGYLAKLRKEWANIARTEPLARYRVVKGDTLQKIAVRFYNQGSYWVTIYDHNKLTTTLLAQGQILEIPKV